MPSTTMEEEAQWKFDEDVWYRCQLVKVEEKSFPYKDKDQKDQVFVKWEWQFKVLDGDKAGLHIYGDTEPKLTNHPDNKVRLWAEALSGIDFEMGQGLDTDDLLGLECFVSVQNITEEKKNGDPFYKSIPKDVVDTATGEALAGEPPF